MPTRAKPARSYSATPAGLNGKAASTSLRKPSARADLDQPLEQHAPGTAPAPFARDIDREIGDMVVAAPRVEHVEACPRDDHAAVRSDEDRMPFALAGEPLAALLRRAQLGLQGREAVENAFVVDAGDGRSVVGFGVPDGEGGLAAGR